VLSREVAPLGIKVTIVEPGGFRTDFAGSSTKLSEGNPDYDSTVGATARFQRDYNGKQNPTSFLAQKILIHEDRVYKDRAKDLLYIHDTIEVFSESLEELRNIFQTDVAPKLHPRRRTELEGAADKLFRKVDDTIREASRMAAGRKLRPERLAESSRAGLGESSVPRTRMTAKQETQSLRKSPSHERPESPFNRGQWDKNESDAVHMKCISNVAESREAS